MSTRRLAALAVLGTVIAPVADAGASSRVFGSRVLQKGSHGHDVRVLQDFLGRAGFGISVDGRYGSATVRTVRRWERATQIAIDGRVSRGDAKKLRSTVAQAEASVGPGGAEYVQVEKAKLNPDGTATPPASAPDVVKQIILAGNEIAAKPYKYGGGHGKWNDSGYDCSGSVSYALHGAGLLDESLDSSGFESWELAGRGPWVTVYANSGHAYMVVAGLRFDTSGAKSRGSRWTADMRSSSGYVARHPTGL